MAKERKNIMIKHLYDELAKRWLSECDSIYICSDPHFSNVELYHMRGLLNIPEDIVFAKEQGDNRSYELFIEGRINFLDEMQIKNINSKAGKNSCLIILGDIGNLDCVKKLKAKRKILIMGNHEKGASNYKRRTIAHYMLNGEIVNGHDNNPDLSDLVAIHGNIDWQGGNIKYIKHRDGYTYEEWFYFADGSKGGTYTEDAKLFDEVYEGPLMINDKVILSHEPIFPTIPFLFNIHGHVHNKNYKGDDHHLNVCAEAIDYTPINLINFIKSGNISHIDSIHRLTIDGAIKRKNKNK